MFIMKTVKTIFVLIISIALLLPSCSDTSLDGEKRSQSSSENSETNTINNMSSLSSNNSIHEHIWGEPTYIWSDDCSLCVAERICLTDNSHKETESATSTYVIVTPATKNSEGLGRYTASFTNTAFGIQTKDVVIEKYYYGEVPKIAADGKTLQYGLYPQTNVNDPDLLSRLNALATLESNGWYFYNDEYYAKTIAEPYERNCEFYDLTIVESGATYWFKCEPIVWDILSHIDNEYFVISSTLLDTHCYCESNLNRVIDGETIFPNNYEYSNVRAWLNNNFYDSAFY